MTKEQIDKIIKDLFDAGKIIEAGWTSLKLTCIPESASEIQLQEMRKAFFAGASHLFSSVLNVLDADREPTDNDIRRMQSLSEELRRFAEQVTWQIN